MSPAHRLPTEGAVSHLTHRCHNRAFLHSFTNSFLVWCRQSKRLFPRQLDEVEARFGGLGTIFEGLFRLPQIYGR
jgi:hypothetical protein